MVSETLISESNRVEYISSEILDVEVHGVVNWFNDCDIVQQSNILCCNENYTTVVTTLTFGDVSNDIEAEICKAILEVRMEGHGDKGHKKNLIFPKLVFLYNPEIHGKGKKYEWLFALAVKCSSKCMYPDFLSPKLHKREGKWVSPIKY